jgi:hypothetical protein
LSLLLGWGATTAACSPASTPPAASGGAPVGSGGTLVSSGGAVVGTGGLIGSGGAVVGSGGAVGSGGDMALGGSCNVPTMEVLARSDTDGNWDDQDFAAGVTISGACPVLIDVTWPHETPFADPDVVDADFEEVFFTLDQYPDVDFTGKQINLTIELAAETLGTLTAPAVPTGGYTVTLMSVSTYEVPVEGSGGAGSGGAGSGGAASGGAGSGGDTGSGGAATTTQYTEAASPAGDLALVGDELTMSFPLPAKGPNNNSYDPATAIKMSIRIRPAWTDVGAPPPDFAFLTAQFAITEFTLTAVTP